MAAPYVGVLLILTAFTMPYLKDDCVQRRISRKKGRVTIKYLREYILLILAYVIYILFAVFKDYKTVGYAASDAYAYYFNFLQAAGSVQKFFENSTFEPGYTLVIWIIREMTENYKWSLYFWHTMTFTLTIYFYKHIYLEKRSALVVFLGLSLLITQFNTNRMSISISIACCSLVAMNQRHWFKALIIALAAVSIHSSAIIMIPVMFAVFTVTNIHKYKKSIIYAITVFGVVLCAALVRVEESIVAMVGKDIYLGNSAIAWGTYIAVLVFFILSIIRFRELIQINALNSVLIIALPICFICIPLQFRIAIMYRLILYFLPIILAIIPSLLTCYKHEKNLWLKIAAYASCYGYLFIRIYNFCTEEGALLGKYAILLN